MSVNIRVLGITLAAILVLSLGCGCIGNEANVEPVPTPDPLPDPEPIPEPEVTPKPTPKPVVTPKPTVRPIVNPIPSNYYEGKCLIPTDKSLIEFLTTTDWKKEYKKGGWDCSQMSARMERELEICGYNTVIQVSIDHAWILIEMDRDGKFYVYETTGMYFPDSLEGYETVEQYDDIYAVWRDYKQYSNGKEIFNNEWGWWLN